MYEHHTHHLLPWRVFLRRAGRHLLIALALIAVAVGGGTVGYHLLNGLGWLDAFLNAAMLLGGEGPIAAPRSRGGKLFAGLYALYSGLILLVSVGIMLAPVFHRFMHRFHLEEHDEEGVEGAPPEKSRRRR